MNVSQTKLKSTVPVLRVTGLIPRPLVQYSTVLRPSLNRAGVRVLAVFRSGVFCLVFR